MYLKKIFFSKLKSRWRSGKSHRRMKKTKSHVEKSYGSTKFMSKTGKRIRHQIPPEVEELKTGRDEDRF